MEKKRKKKLNSSTTTTPTKTARNKSKNDRLNSSTSSASSTVTTNSTNDDDITDDADLNDTTINILDTTNGLDHNVPAKRGRPCKLRSNSLSNGSGAENENENIDIDEPNEDTNDEDFDETLIDRRKVVSPSISDDQWDETGKYKSVSSSTDTADLSPCQSGTNVLLDGIIWNETNKGMLILNVTWRGKQFVGSLIDTSKSSWAPPR
jgi:hypothetical protein